MLFNPEFHHRRSIRLKDYDYSRSGAYFVTICVRQRECLFGEIKSGEMHLNKYGRMVEASWDDLPNHYHHVEIDESIVMPNHIHGIIVLNNVGAGLKPAPTKQHGLPEIVRAFKTFSARQINHILNTPGIPLWQRNYYERIIRDERELNAVREYIRQNALKWDEDEENPIKQGQLSSISSSA
jgi:REP element-mobilizing transposase RayT